MPWRRPTPLDVVCLGGLAATLVWAAASTAFVPALIGTHPVLLEVVNGGWSSMLAAGAFVRLGRALLIAAVLAPVLSWVPWDPFAWWAGKRYGRAAAQLVLRGQPGAERLLTRTEHFVQRYGWFAVPLAPWLPLPTTLIYAAAGWGEMPLWQFVGLDVLGTIARSATIVAIGYAVGGDAVSVATTISHNALLASVALLAAIALWVLWRFRRGRAPRRSGPVDDLTK